ncbi:flagellar motor protein MotB [Thiopseudomonas acetoxidans]|uniref:Flagellar motor protein MotB n=1 Tax=Thiopseudomonas acetoxidans TaxID=3041622 RepID=A0ABT7SPX2_9GAMM|nr:flagellar motor protein MotB [Thiopseudomonas sp. CY1220]MDM7858235.1 flagellar motor protein MotB [Thiopseudomonas sp. CY1220]
MSGGNQPIIIKRVKKVSGGSHGGSWKIAFADFAIAMMAFFLVMWLLSSATPEQLKAISGYFQDPVGYSQSASPYVIDLGGTPTPSATSTINPEINDEISLRVDTEQSQGLDKESANLLEQLEQERLNLLLLELQNKLEESKELEPYLDQISLAITQDGLRIQISDAENRPMFSLGSAKLQPHFEDILYMMAGSFRAVPNKISIGGHTDAKPYSGAAEFGNWELSASRANSARRALRSGGLEEAQIARVSGYASSMLFDRKDPYNPVNRRIDILVLTKRAQEEIEGTETGLTNEEVNQSKEQVIEQTKPMRERLNLFEDGLLDMQPDRRL